MKNNYFRLNFIGLFTILFAFYTHVSQAQAVKVIANQVSYFSPNVPSSLADLPPYNKATAINRNNAIQDNDNYARLVASPGILVGLGSYSGAIELSFPRTLTPDTWSNVRLQGDSDLFGVLLGGSLGNLLGDVLGVVLLGRQRIEIQARDASGDIVLSRTSSDGFDTDRIRLVEDAEGNFLLAIRPDKAYDRLRIINRSISALGLGSEYNLDVYNAFFIDGEDTCGDFKVTSYDGEGINLEVMDLGGAGVKDLGNAIDGDPNTYSSISIGTLGVGASMFQNVYFNSLGSEQDYFKLS